MTPPRRLTWQLKLALPLWLEVKVNLISDPLPGPYRHSASNLISAPPERIANQRPTWPTFYQLFNILPSVCQYIALLQDPQPWSARLANCLIFRTSVRRRVL